MDIKDDMLMKDVYTNFVGQEISVYLPNFIIKGVLISAHAGILQITDLANVNNKTGRTYIPMGHVLAISGDK